MSWTEIMTSHPLYQNTFILRRSAGANFAEIIKIVTIEKTFKDSKEVERIRNQVFKWNLSVFLGIAKFDFP